MKILLVAGARPNFMKIAPIMKAMADYKNMETVLVHTGQHYDWDMSGAFFKDLDMPAPDVHLGVGSASHAVQTARVMQQFEKVLMNEAVDLVLVAGDVNSTMACALTAAKLNIKIAHVESGLRSFDRTMPEETNRVVTDHLSDFLFTTCEDANNNLRREGIPEDKIFFAGNVMIDSLLYYKEKLKTVTVSRNPLSVEKKYALLTLHRPGNVDAMATLERISRALNRIAEKIPIIFSVHPRARKQINKFGLQRYYSGNIKLLPPLGYLDFLNLYSGAALILTDSGGIQEETTVLNIPCLTIRENTERPITIEQGTNVLVGTDEEKIVKEAGKILRGERKWTKGIKYWDGHASERIVEFLLADKNE